MNTLGDAMPADLRVQVSEMQSEMEVCTKVLRQHMEDSMRPNCLNRCLNPTENYTCNHEHKECDMCVKSFRALALVDLLISKVADERRKKMFQRARGVAEECGTVYGTYCALSCTKTHAGCNT